MLENCTLTSSSGNNAKGSLLVNAGAQVHLQEVSSFGPSLRVLGKATVTQCAWQGQNIQGFSNAAIVVQGSGTVQVNTCNVTGGSSSVQTAGAAIDAAAGTRAWVVASALAPGGSVVPVCAVTGAGTVEVARSIVGGTCPIPQSPEGLGVQRLGAILTASAFTIEYTTVPFHPVGVHVSFELGDFELPWLLAQPWGAALGTSVDVGVGLSDSLGNVTFSWAIPANPLLVGLPLWLHGFSGVTLPLQVSAPVGGVIR